MTKKTFNPWPVAIAVICIGAFAGAAAVVVVMLKQRVELVRPDYYAQDQRHEERMQQERRAKENPVAIAHDAASAEVALAFTSPDVSGTVTLFRPSDLTMDRKVEIAVDGQGRQAVSTQGMAAGLWRIRVEWEQNGESHYQERMITL